ncbi:hypothetical protein GCM10010365_25960 [Streptomyces poonensis]|uniref:Uncharacterized protein n=1 Tax=Streptomyces poonensis TaxID=68255 RepID=A0A918UFT0_9ACTN|nr:hypothetical protein GCM10010365_25960 [Streptomyces poonensis]GLJ92560.1 hypothetical protein GCM10017589_51700 [Streptomyces poonensis]
MVGSACWVKTILPRETLPSSRRASEPSSATLCRGPAVEGKALLIVMVDVRMGSSLNAVCLPAGVRGGGPRAGWIGPLDAAR